MSAYVDLTEFLAHPHRTGIQRVTGELCRYWPASSELIPVKVRRDGTLGRLPADTLQVISDYFGGGSVSPAEALERIQFIDRIGENGDGVGECLAVNLRGSDVLLCPEVFYDGVRLDFYQHLPAPIRARCCFIVFDLLPLTHPEYFEASVPHQVICRYVCLLREIGHLAFISRATQKAFYQRFLRSSRMDGQVMHLGSDGLGERARFAEDRLANRSFVVVGTIEPRKNHGLILETFELILQRVEDVELIFLGRVGWIGPQMRERLEQFQLDYPRFQLIADAGDRTLRDYVQNARATIFVSAVEGFGLPPVESLWLGTPVIASPGIPSLEDYGLQGIHVVDPLTPEGLREAAAAFLNDGYYRKKLAEARSVKLPTWSQFAAEVAAWVRGVQSTASV